MIIGIPTADDFQNAGLNLLHLAWRMAIASIHAFNDANREFENYSADPGERETAHKTYWLKMQPELGNAFTLIQQGIELGLKGRIAAISPYLLIARDARDYPSGSDKSDVEFSAFRTLDASDLFRVHNTHCAVRLDEDFRIFWDEVRRRRNALIHSVSNAPPLEPGELLNRILKANEFIFGPLAWPERRLESEGDDEFSEFPLSYDLSRLNLMSETGAALDWLTPKDAKMFYGFNKKQRCYLCPTCYYEIDHHVRDEVPHLAQLKSKSSAAKELWCCVCRKVTRVERSECKQPGCVSNVISDETDTVGMCLACGRYSEEEKE